jgi:hypothetical protein
MSAASKCHEGFTSHLPEGEILLFTDHAITRERGKDLQFYVEFSYVWEKLSCPFRHRQMSLSRSQSVLVFGTTNR